MPFHSVIKIKHHEARDSVLDGSKHVTIVFLLLTLITYNSAFDTQTQYKKITHYSSEWC
jgi:hypothetical protein